MLPNDQYTFDFDYWHSSDLLMIHEILTFILFLKLSGLFLLDRKQHIEKKKD